MLSRDRHLGWSIRPPWPLTISMSIIDRIHAPASSGQASTVELGALGSSLGRSDGGGLQLGDKPDLSEREVTNAEEWRVRVRSLPVLPIIELKNSEVNLRRGHLVLAWVLHYYIQTHSATADVHIPPSITLPLLQICAQLQLPPVLTYADNTFYNWDLKVHQGENEIPRLDNLRCPILFTGTEDEQEFYLASTRIELRGVEALELMRATMDEAFVGDDIALRRITSFLLRLAVVIKDLRELLLGVRKGCNPDVFYNQGLNSSNRKWIFEGLEDDPSLTEPSELSGPSAGQSPLIHALDIFLGVDRFSHAGSNSSPGVAALSFLDRMQLYMARHHRAFLNHLKSNPRPLRDIVLSADNASLLEAYNNAVVALKEFRDAHMIIITMYIVGPSRRAQPIAAAPTEGATAASEYSGPAPLKGTGGTDVVNFLKGVRDSTAEALIH
ncbi:Indoleamine2,3-dioxygenase [Salix suchowensis]|nr:Indoleamine2,3-dioxygenase [Salix suchowensis]